jgi:peptide/nickel transport system substrate-binding protein
MFEGLVQYIPGTTQLEPVLATNLGETTDSQKWTYYLRRGIKFHDGTDFDAHAVKAHFDNAYETMAGLTYLFSDSLLDDSRTTSSVVVIDDYTIEFNLNYPSNIWPDILANFACFIESPASVEKYGVEGISDNPVGTGPFKFVRKTIGEEFVMEANQDWWRLTSTAADARIAQSKIAVTKLIFKRVSDPSTLRFAIETGSIDVAHQKFNPTDYPDLLAIPSIQEHDTGSVSKLRMLIFQGNPKFTTFQDKRMRQAFSHAIDYELIIESVFGGLAERVYSYLPPEYQQYKAAATYKYDPDKAKELIEAAGFDTPVKVKLYWTPSHYGETERDVVTIIKASALAAGFDVDISDGPDYQTFRSYREPDIMEMSLWGWSSDYVDQDAFTNPFVFSEGWTAGQFDTHMSDFATMIDIIDPLVIEAQSTPDPIRKKEIVFELQDIWAEWVPQVFMWRTKLYSFTRSNVQGVVFGPVGAYDVQFYGAYKTE